MKANAVGSRIHGFTYSLIACQGAYLATYFPSVYWNTAYLRVVSGLDSEESTSYSKVAKGVCEITSKNIKISPIDINKSGYMFEPDEEHNTIYYSMKALTGLNGEIIEEIIANRPYTSLQDFMSKVKCNKTTMISLIKSGAFDQFGERKDIMTEYIWSVCEPKKRLTMQNFAGLMEKKLLPQELNFEQQLFRYNKLLKKNCKSKEKGYLVLENRDMPYYDYYEKYFNLDYVQPDDNNNLIIEEKQWKKQYDDKMKPAKDYITNNQKELLEKMNNSLFQEMWNKYAAGNYSSWEMDSMSYYYHPHELINVNKGMYDIVEYNSLPSSPIVEKTFSKGGRNIPIYATQKICGTVIAKDDSKSIVVILTPESGVVNVKFTREYYARLNKQISQRQPDGTKKVIESPWTKKGTLVVVNGFKRDNMFVGKAYKRDNAYQFYKITKVYNNGTIDMINSRADEV